MRSSLLLLAHVTRRLLMCNLQIVIVTVHVNISIADIAIFFSL